MSSVLPPELIHMVMSYLSDEEKMRLIKIDPGTFDVLTSDERFKAEFNTRVVVQVWSEHKLYGRASEVVLFNWNDILRHVLKCLSHNARRGFATKTYMFSKIDTEGLPEKLVEMLSKIGTTINSKFLLHMERCLHQATNIKELENVIKAFEQGASIISETVHIKRLYCGTPVEQEKMIQKSDCTISYNRTK